MVLQHLPSFYMILKNPWFSLPWLFFGNHVYLTVVKPWLILVRVGLRMVGSRNEAAGQMQML